MLLSVIVVSYNTQTLTLQALRSAQTDALHSQLLKKDTELIVIDNNSSDDSLTALKEFKKQSQLPFTVIENSENVGFARANNQGIAVATGKYILLLNSDTIVEAGALETMVQTFEDMPDMSSSVVSSEHGKIDHLGILAATLKNPDGTLQHQGGSLPSLASLFFHMSFIDDLPIIGQFLPSTQHTGKRADKSSDAHILTPSGWVGGTALMIRREVIDEIGALDEHIFMYGEDVEWCMRAQAHHWDVAIHNHAYITHLQAQSSSSENALKGELLGYQYIWSKHKPFWQIPIAKTILLLGIFLRIGIFSVLGKTAQAKLYYRIFKTISKVNA